MVALKVNDGLSEKTLQVDVLALAKLKDPAVMSYIKEICNDVVSEKYLNINIVSKSGLKDLKSNPVTTLVFLKKIVKTHEGNYIYIILLEGFNVTISDGKELIQISMKAVEMVNNFRQVMKNSKKKLSVKAEEVVDDILYVFICYFNI